MPDSDPETGGGCVTACTIVARNYLPAARVLASSYLKHHPHHRFVIAVIDGAEAGDGRGEDAEGYAVVGPEAFAIDRDDYLRMATAYSLTELATAVKPFLLLGLRRASDVVLYLDPDIRVFAPMAEVPELARAHQLVLAPHLLEPMPRDGLEPSENVIMGTGTFNLGFLATGPGSEGFLRFWARRLRHDAIVAPEQQLFTDQRWVDQVPALFGHHVLRDPGYDVAYWNVHERPVARAEDGTVTAGGAALRFFHFSGYRPEKPWLLTYHCARRPRILLSEHPVLHDVCDGYAAELRDAGYARSVADVPYRYAALADGTTLTSLMRRVYRDGWIAAEAPAPSGGHSPDEDRPETPPHAFGVDGGVAFADWLASPANAQQRSAGLNRLLIAAWSTRPDLHIAFPQPCGESAPGFRYWCTNSGSSEFGFPTWALPGPGGEPPAPPGGAFGVNVLGYLTAELGLGEMGRIVHDAIGAAQIPVVSVVEDRALTNRTAVRPPATAGTPRFGVSLLCVNADQTDLILQRHPDIGADRYRIGFWAWELEEFPEWLHGAFDLVDEVWTVSDFCAESIAAHSPVPVHTFPVPVVDPGPTVSRGDPDGVVRFLFAFDFNSVGERKNPWGVVSAFRAAFPDRADVRLTIKAINGSRHPHAAERLRAATRADPRIDLIERYLDAGELHRLYESASCYVSLHRSEGFGLTIAEAMARGLPVIATDYSGSTEFVDAECGWPVPYRMTRVGPDSFPYQEGALWAEPDLDAAAAAMRAVADDPDEARRRGSTARERILGRRTQRAATDWLRERLSAAHQRWSDRAHRAALPEANPLQPLLDAEEALRWRPETDAPARNPMAPAARKLVLRALDHYDVHQRRTLATVKHSTEEVLSGMLARIEALEQRAEDAERDARRRAASVGALDRALAGARRAGLESRSAVAEVEADVAELRGATADGTRERESLRDSLAETQRHVHEMLVERDVRQDTDEHVIARVQDELAAARQAAVLRHAPIPPGSEVVPCDVGPLLVPSDGVILPWLVEHRSWEPDEAALMAGLADGGCFLDIGAHVGYHSLRMLASGAPLDRVVAVEANPDTVALLRRNVTANLSREAARLVTVLHAAAWDSDGDVRLAPGERGNSGDFRVHPGDTGGVPVPALRLDRVPDVLAGRVGLVKVDLQGRDHRALAGLAGVLHRDRPHVVCEFSPDSIAELGDDPADVLAGYAAHGYEIRVCGQDTAPAHAELVARARAAASGYLTLWLRP